MEYSPMYTVRDTKLWCLVCNEEVYSWTARGEGQQRMFHINEKHHGLPVISKKVNGKKVWYYGHS